MNMHEQGSEHGQGEEQEHGEAGFAYDGVRFRPVEAGHDPGAPTTVGLYHSRGDELWAEFAGGKVRTGRLVGAIRPDGTIDGAYCQVSMDGRSAAGTLVSVPDRLPDGRIRLHEHWRRADGSSGVSVIEQIDAPGGGPLSSAQLGYLRDEIYRQLRTHLGTADVLAATRCATRLLDQCLDGRIPSELTVQVAHDGDAAGTYMLAFVRAMQLITARVHDETFVLRAATGVMRTVTGRRGEPPSRTVADNIERASQVLGLHEDPWCELVNAQDDRVGEGVDAVITASTAEAHQGPESQQVPFFSIGTDTSGAPHAHRPVLADLLKFESEEPHDARTGTAVSGLDEGEDR
ncbi:hypothetical protein [Catenulispora pinisilvae]|uniref:hypothetical protein n=1 Tax=Catenulispora pinisilvae TaxID=2705253 RepID=UPI001E4B4F7C|nr:hypothetical protein [Catenulispora pinisilvae]